MVHEPESVPQAEVVTTEPTLLGYNKAKKSDNEGNAPEKILFRGQVPSMASAVFDGNRFLIYHVFEGNIEVEGIRVTALSEEGPLAVDLKVTAESSLDLLHKLAARKKIQELEEEFDSSNPWFRGVTDPNKDEIKAVALMYSLTSRYTSFIGVDRNTNKTQWDDAMVRRDILNQIPKGFGPNFLFVANSAARHATVFQNQSYVPTEGGGHCDEDIEYDPPINQFVHQSATVDRHADWSKGYVQTDGGGHREDVGNDVVDDVLQELVNNQNFDGSYTWSSCFQTVGLKKDQVDQAKPEHVSENVWLSAIAMKILELKLESQKDSWALIAAKIQKFVCSQVQDMDALMKDAEKVVSSFC